MKAELALEMFASSVRKYIGAYAVSMGAFDAIVFTAGVGENGPQMRLQGIPTALLQVPAETLVPSHAE